VYLLNGEPSQFILASDRGLQYGDGLFETLEVFNGRPLFFNLHFQRLQQGCQRLQIPCPDSSLLRQESQRLIAEATRAVLKILITRGSGGRGYRQPVPIEPTRLLSLHPYPGYHESFYTQGVIARVCQQRLSMNPALAGIKHLNRLEQVLARAEWNDDFVQEGLMLDTLDNVIEGTMSNLFFAKDGCLFTADLTQCGINGIVRQLLIELAEQNDMAVCIKSYGLDELLSADELFVCNSVIGLWPIRQLAGRSCSVGPITQRLQVLFNQVRLSGD